MHPAETQLTASLPSLCAFAYTAHLSFEYHQAHHLSLLRIPLGVVEASRCLGRFRDCRHRCLFLRLAIGRGRGQLRVPGPFAFTVVRVYGFGWFCTGQHRSVCNRLQGRRRTAAETGFAGTLRKTPPAIRETSSMGIGNPRNVTAPDALQTSHPGSRSLRNAVKPFSASHFRRALSTISWSGLADHRVRAGHRSCLRHIIS